VQETLVPWTSSDSIKHGYILQKTTIRTSGRKICLFVGDKQLVEIIVDRKSSGKVGFVVGPNISIELLGISLSMY